jgi:hypothetical protein
MVICNNEEVQTKVYFRLDKQSEILSLINQTTGKNLSKNKLKILLMVINEILLIT